MSKLITISELSKKLNLIDKNNKKPLNHTLRFWEKEFKEIKRRYYSIDQVEKIKIIKFLLKDKGMTIKGAKKVLNFNRNNLDVTILDSLKAEYYKKDFKEKSKKILDKIKKLKNYGKKNSY